ncbi:nitrilase family protein, partial [Acinetobacter rudis]
MDMDENPVSPIKVAVLQFDPQVGTENRERNLRHGLSLAQEAVNHGANLIVMPELANTGYLFTHRNEAFDHSEEIPNGPSTQVWQAFAQKNSIYLVAGISERDGFKLYDSSVLIGPDGFIGKYRKTHLWNLEKLWFSPGDMGYPVFETPIGRIGMMICWDVWFPEVPRILAQQGADIICSVNNWVWTPPPLFDESGKCMASYLTITASHVNNVYIAAANRVGVDRGERFLGCSLITGTNGWPIAGVADSEKEMILYADIDL